MKKVLPILIVIIAISAFGVYFMTRGEDERNIDSEFLTDNRLLEMSQSPSELANFIYTVKDNPSQVVSTNATLWKMIYNYDEYTKAERENLITMQRMLFSQFLLDENSKEWHILTVESEIEQWEKYGFKIIGSDLLPPVYGDIDLIDEKYQAKELVAIKVVFYTNEKETEDYEPDLYREYIVIKNQLNKWEIIGWVDVDKFDIVK